MSQQAIPPNPTYYYQHYAGLKGIDLTTDVTQVPRNRAADMLNMLPDEETGNPRKRRGWRKLYSFGDSEKFIGARHIVEWNVDILVTTKGIYLHDSANTSWEAADVTTLASNPTNTSEAVAFIGFDTDGHWLINAHMKRYSLTLTGGAYTLTELTDGYIPTTVISRDPDGSNGWAYEGVNAYTPKRMIQFLGNNTATTFFFYPAADRGNHLVVAVEKVEVRDSNGVWQDATFTTTSGSHTFTAYSNQAKTSSASYTDIVSFTLSNAAEPVVPGQDNIRATVVEFSPDVDENGIYYGYWSPIVDGILTNGVCARYGMASMDREFFIADNHKIYYTDPDMFDFLPDNNFIWLTTDTPIMGFHRKNTFLVAISEDSAEHTIHMISGATSTITHRVINEQGVTEESTEQQTYFTAKVAMTGTGAIAKNAFATLVDDTLFLARRGIYGITSNNTTSETVIANRSELINPRLIEEPNLEQAAATIWQGMYLVALNGHMYVLDSRDTHNNRGVSYGYECYYLDNIPAKLLLSYEGNLFFGDGAGNWCRFNTDIDNNTAFSDDGEIDEHGNITNGTAIHAMWKTRLDADGYPQYLKTLNKRGTAIELAQLQNSGVRVSYSKDGGEPIFIADLHIANKFTWTLVDFENFSFDATSNVRTFYPKKKLKKYKYLQFVLESVENAQNFGVVGITKTYYLGNFAKR